MAKLFRLGSVKNVVETYVPSFETPERYDQERAERLALIRYLRAEISHMQILLVRLEKIEQETISKVS